MSMIPLHAALSALTAVLYDVEPLRPDQSDVDLARSQTEPDLRRAKAIRAAIAAYDSELWRPIKEATKDRTVIWAYLRIPAETLAERKDLARFDGIQIPLQHPGVYEKDGRVWDHGWVIAAPVGQGGFPDEWIAGWRCMPAGPGEQPSVGASRARDAIFDILASVREAVKPSGYVSCDESFTRGYDALGQKVRDILDAAPRPEAANMPTRDELQRRLDTIRALATAPGVDGMIYDLARVDLIAMCDGKPIQPEEGDDK